MPVGKEKNQSIYASGIFSVRRKKIAHFLIGGRVDKTVTDTIRLHENVFLIAVKTTNYIYIKMSLPHSILCSTAFRMISSFEIHTQTIFEIARLNSL